MDYTEIVSRIMVSPALLALGLAILFFLVLAFYIYTSIAWVTIARKLKYKKSWLAWIPIVNFSMIFRLGGFHWAWVFLVLIPILGWIPLIVLLVTAIIGAITASGMLKASDAR